MINFKEGDWIKVNHVTTKEITIHKIKQLFEGNFYNVLLEDNIIVDAVTCRLWQPQENEWCWDKNEGFVQVMKIYDNKIECQSYKDYFKQGYTTINCFNLEPFIGNLPSFLGYDLYRKNVK